MWHCFSECIDLTFLHILTLDIYSYTFFFPAEVIPRHCSLRPRRSLGFYNISIFDIFRAAGENELLFTSIRRSAKGVGRLSNSLQFQQFIKFILPVHFTLLFFTLLFFPSFFFLCPSHQSPYFTVILDL